MNAPPASMILVLAAAENTARMLESHLRNRGHAVRTAWVSDMDELEDTLRRAPPQLLLIEQGVSGADPALMFRRCRQLDASLPMLLLTDTFDVAASLLALTLDADDAVAMDSNDGLLHLERRSIQCMAHRQQLQELDRLRLQMARYETRHSQLVRDTHDAIVHLSEGIVTACNPAFAALLGHDDSHHLDGTPLLDIVTPDHAGAVKVQLKRLSRPRSRWTDDDLVLRCALMDAHGGTVDIEADIRMSEASGERSLDLLIRAPAPTADATGPATGGRSALRADLEVLSANDKQRLCLLGVVLDDLKGLEGRIGFLDLGDLLDTLEQWIDTRLGVSDRLFRTGNGEWILLLRGHDPAKVETWARTLGQDAQRQLFSTVGHETHLSLTIVAYPVAIDESAADIPARVISEAQQRSAKGGKTVSVLGAVAKATAHVKGLEKQAAAVRSALQEGRLRLAFQSIASLEGDARLHYDVLLRMTDASGHELLAAEFIDAARQFNLMAVIDQWVIGQALKVQDKRRAGAASLAGLFVKLSEQSLREVETLIPWLQKHLSEPALRPGEIIFELPESALQNHIRKAKQLIDAVHALGATVAIDQFGMSAQAAQLLDHLPVAFIKFHPAFTREPDNKERMSRMTELIEIAGRKKIKTIVSHVENAQAMAKLWQLGANYVQGYSVQEPEVVMLAADHKR